MSQKIVGVILTAIALVVLSLVISFQIYTLLGVPIILLGVGIGLIRYDSITNKTASEETFPSENKENKLQGLKVAGWILAIIGSIQFIVFIRIELYFLLFLPILLFTIGAILIAITLNKDKKNATIQPDLSSLNTETKANNGPISHDSEEYRRWKEGR